jgi:SAM-dependent methyltransferase
LNTRNAEGATQSDLDRGKNDYFSGFLESSAVEFLERLAVPASASLLDVACGSGQLALFAARRGARVTGVDIASNAILIARDRARTENLAATFDEGDAESLPYPDASFVLYSSFRCYEAVKVVGGVRLVTPCGQFPVPGWESHGRRARRSPCRMAINESCSSRAALNACRH